MSDDRSRRLLGEEAQSKFKRFEVLVVAVGSVAIIISAVFSYLGTRSLLELIGQLLMLPVLLIALNYGKTGGLVSALCAIAIYVFARSPDLKDFAIMRESLDLLGVRALGYLIVGFIGGQAMTTIKYYFARSGGLGGVDPGSGVYSADFIKGMIEKEIRTFERYESVFSVILIELADEMARKSDRFKKDRNCRGFGTLLKNDVRLADEVGRMGEFTFILLLSHTRLDGAQVVADRVSCATADYFSIPLAEGVLARVYTVPDHLEELRKLVGIPAPAKPVGVSSSGETIERE